MQNKTPRTTLIEELIEQLHVIGRHVGPGREQFLCNVDLNHAQLKFLYFISTGKEMTIQRLVDMTKTTPGAVTQLVDGLIEKGFLLREHDENDKRRVFIKFSTEGKKKFQKMKTLHIKFLRSVFGVLTDEELRQMVAIEKKLVLNLSTKYS